MRAQRGPARAQFSIERTYAAPIDRVWALWTTRHGIESWWGPEGFEVKVTSLDLRPGGELRYEMTAVAPEQVAFMKQAGMALTTRARVTYTEVTPGKRLAYKTVADFMPGVEPYDVATGVEFQATAGGVRLVITVDAMHDEVWTARARAGNESQLRKLDALLGTH
ncbi:MAG: SRPBCC domain-containing protein [Gammaproteobacteria bacterium]|nr:SRPBCC domain-containing protein [Gammaproteobacteria bacterium]